MGRCHPLAIGETRNKQPCLACPLVVATKTTPKLANARRMKKDDRVRFSSLSGKIVIADDQRNTTSPSTAASTTTTLASDNGTLLIVDTLSLKDDDGDDAKDVNGSNAGFQDEEAEETKKYGEPCIVGRNDVTATVSDDNDDGIGGILESMNDDAALAPPGGCGCGVAADGGGTDIFGRHVDDHPHHTGNSQCMSLDDNLVMMVDDEYEDGHEEEVDVDGDCSCCRGKDDKESYTDINRNATETSSSFDDVDDEVVLIIEDDSIHGDEDNKYDFMTNDPRIIHVKGVHNQQQDLEAPVVEDTTAGNVSKEAGNNSPQTGIITRQNCLLPDISSKVDVDDEVREFLRQVRLAPSRPPIAFVPKANKSSSSTTSTGSQMENRCDNSSKATCSYDGKIGNNNEDDTNNGNEKDDNREEHCFISSWFAWNPSSCRLSLLCRQRVRDFNAMHYPAKVISDTDDIFYYNGGGHGGGGFWGGNVLMHHFHRALSFSRHLPTCSFVFVIFTIFLAIGAFSAALGQYLYDTNHHLTNSNNHGGNETITNSYNDTDMMNSGPTVVPTPRPTSPLIGLLSNIGNENDDTEASNTNIHYHQQHDNRKPRQPLDWVNHDDHPNHPHV